MKNSEIKKIVTLDIDKNNSLELCKNDPVVNCTERVRRLAYIRQQGLNSVLASGTTYDYICMLDMDFVDYDKKRLDDMFIYMENNEDVDAIFGMSKISNFGLPYDVGAIKPLYKIPLIMSKIKRYVEVDSAFSGFGIYRYSSVFDNQATYDYKNTKDVEHIDFNKKLNKLVVDTHFNPVYDLLDNSLIVKYFLIVLILFVIPFYLIKNMAR